MPKTKFYNSLVHDVLFIMGELKITKWYITLHSASVIPTQAEASLEWFKDNSYSSCVIDSWTNNPSNPEQIVNNTEIKFNPVPSNITWSIKYYFLWCEDFNKNLYPVFYRELDSALQLTEGDVLTIPLHQLSIQEA